MRYILSTFLLILFLVIVAPVSAALLQEGVTNPDAGLIEFGNDIGYNTTDETPIAVKIGDAIKIVLGFIGTIFLILMIISGFQWMTAGGNAETITKAKQRIINATIGLVVTLAAFAITYFITYNLINITGYQG